jgi:hypothetical protein
MFETILAGGINFDFGTLLNQLDQMGFFRYVLPFLLVFALVYSISTKIEIFKGNRGAAILISAAIGLLVLQLNYVPEFFQNVFPKFGIGLSILLIAMILAGAFVPDEAGKKTVFGWIFFTIGAIIFIIVTILSFADWNYGNSWWDQYGAMVIVALIIITAMVLVMVLSKKD